MLCKNCATLLAEGALFCHKCGTKVENTCSSCGKELIEGALFCPYCGSKVGGTKAEEKRVQEISKSEIIDEDWFANNKSVYTNSYGKDFNRMYYQGRIYFLSSSSNEIWRMYEDGSELERVLIRDKNDTNKYIGVNRRGIFTYDTYSNPYVYNYSFTGELLNTVKLQVKKDQIIKDFCIFDDRIYYITTDETDNPKQNLYSIGIDGSNPFIIYKGTTKTELERVLAKDSYVLFYINFYANDQRSNGWYKYDLETQELVNLNSIVLPPHELLTHPKRFDCDSKSYIDDVERVEIFSFDLINDIMWTFASESEANKMSLGKKERRRTLFPRRIGVAPQQPIIDIDDTWTLPQEFYGYSYSDNYIFNGEYLYYIESYYEIYGVDRNGTLSADWNKTGHGRCDSLQLTGNSLIGDVYADYVDFIYPNSFEKPDSEYITRCDWETPFILNRHSLFEIKKGISNGYNDSRKLYICADINEEDITGFDYCERYFNYFNNIEVDDENPYFVVEDGMLFNADKSKLIRYFGPSYMKELKIPASVIEIGSYAFANKYIFKLILPNSLKKISEYGLSGLEIKESLEIPESVITIEKGGFYRVTIEDGTLILPSSITEIGEEAFINLYTNESVIYCQSGSFAEMHIKVNYERLQVVSYI